jgi:hydroxylamine dehydrogenase
VGQAPAGNPSSQEVIMRTRSRSWTILVTALLVVIGVASTMAQSETGDRCLACHKEKTPGLFNQWNGSKHAAGGVTCLECHQAAQTDDDAFMHEGTLVATLVTPKDCAQCHPDEASQVQASYHATAGEILESQDAYLAHVAGGEPAAITGCENCHGCKVKFDNASPNKLSAKSWPNSGIGRLNPDGSKGACHACHTRHSFSAAQARQPESCSKCHLGPDHPQREVYEESKHGNAYYTHLDAMNLKSDRWVVGQDYFEAPTCATCHMSATSTAKVTHDVGTRLSWTLRPAVSVHKDNWEAKRTAMKDVCSTCHGGAFVDGHYKQFDATVALYNDKFAKPAGTIMQLVRKNNLLERPADFSNEIEWVYWELWHHEGRRMRHGAAMMGPDYTWWHGAYEVAKHFYFELIPEAREYNNPEVNAYIDSLLANDPMHKWLSTATAELKGDIRSGKSQDIYRRMFEQ